jgi:hypothetical protein
MAICFYNEIVSSFLLVTKNTRLRIICYSTVSLKLQALQSNKTVLADDTQMRPQKFSNRRQYKQYETKNRGYSDISLVNISNRLLKKVSQDDTIEKVYSP